jgi:hypothetical protein
MFLAMVLARYLTIEYEHSIVNACIPIIIFGLRFSFRSGRYKLMKL